MGWARLPERETLLPIENQVAIDSANELAEPIQYSPAVYARQLIECVSSFDSSKHGMIETVIDQVAETEFVPITLNRSIFYSQPYLN